MKEETRILNWIRRPNTYFNLTHTLYQKSLSFFFFSLPVTRTHNLRIKNTVIYQKSYLFLLPKLKTSELKEQKIHESWIGCSKIEFLTQRLAETLKQLPLTHSLYQKSCLFQLFELKNNRNWKKNQESCNCITVSPYN